MAIEFKCDYGSRTCDNFPTGVAILHAKDTNRVIEARPICDRHSKYVIKDELIQFVRFTTLDGADLLDKRVSA